MTMEVRNGNLAIDVNKNVKAIDINKSVKASVNLKRKRANQCAEYITAFAASLKNSDPSLRQSRKRIKTDVQECCSQEFEHCSEKAVLQNCGNFHKNCSGKLFLHNYDNFRKSSLPKRVMHFWEGEWNDFPVNTLAPLKEAFQAGKAVSDVSIDSSSYLVDFLHMVLIDLKNGMQRSIAWIDENDKCFSPTYVVEGNCRFKGRQGDKDKHVSLGSEKVQQIEVKVEIGISGTDSPKSENSSELSVTHVKSQKFQAQVLHTDSSDSEHDSSDTQNQCRVFPSGQLKEVFLDNGAGDVTAAGILPKDLQYGWCMGTNRSGSHFYGMFSDRLIKLEEGDHEFSTVQNRFLAGDCTHVTYRSIVGIHRILSSSVSAKARLQAFQNHVEITRECRGNANVLHAWHGTSRKCVPGLIVHGFGPSQIRTLKGGAANGIGVYLTPEDCFHASAAYSDVDENGEQHVVLCQVIMGNMEEVKPGSQQLLPSNENFDSGVDNIKNPKCYVIWSTRMNTHIHPEYVVSFKVSAEVREYWAGLRANYGSHGFNDTLMGPRLQRGITCETARIQQAPASANEMDKKLQEPADVPVKATTAWIHFPVLFSVIQKHLSTSDIDSLQRYYADFKKRKISRGDLIKRMRMIAGDKLVINAIKYIQSQKIGMQGHDEVEEGLCSGIQYEKVHSKSGFALLGNKLSHFVTIHLMTFQIVLILLRWRDY
ncbi:inactive poly [ADP-ribose] polymerase RCD1 isoform X2 [Cryptomeria japonica]|uniref:inactive poly [ADP-ribose] polymerase RCD1 isoform X2 n=1 Tax=Cryptomeria japonica TaxID=3369 RepID=UPI0025AD5BD7|nr:inactive poly [ADP-ribose] polymerase RCD1 isoform X2 [Cryptomeria japonica]